MRYIFLKAVDNPVVPGDRFSYQSALYDILRARQQDEHMDYARMGKMLRLIEAVESAKDGEWLKLQETDWEIAKPKVEKHVWPYFNKIFMDLVAAVVEAKDTEPESEPADAPAAIEIEGEDKVALGDEIAVSA